MLLELEREVIMSSINLYKIEYNQCENFLEKLNSSEFENRYTQKIEKDGFQFEFSLFFYENGSEKRIPWNWVLEAFEQDPLKVSQSPRAIILIELDNDGEEEKYAITFGTAFFLVDKFCDREFAFDFATRLHFNSVKTTTLTSPNSNRNRMINTYVDYNEIDFESGESFAKLKATISDITDPPLFKPTIEIGNSIKFVMENDELSSIAEILLFIFKTLKCNKINKIPLFKPVKDEKLLLDLESYLDVELLKSTDTIDEISTIELEIIGASEVFNHLDNEVEFKFNRKQAERCQYLSLECFKKYCEKNNIKTIEDIKSVNITHFRNGEKVVTKKIKECIDYTVDALHGVLYKGEWYEYNADYLEYLNESTNEIINIYRPQYNFNATIHDAFLKSIYKENFPDAVESNYLKNMEKLKDKYYTEYSFNCLRENDGLFTNYDRINTSIGFEMMDLYEKESCTMFAVKMGGTSSKLCYVVDQSLAALKGLKGEHRQSFPEIKQVGLWFIFDKTKPHKLKTLESIDLSDVKMIMLKNRLDHWKKQVRLAGLQPVLYINYKI